MKDLSNENIIHVKNGDIEYIQFKKLLEYNDELEHCFTIKPLDFGDNAKATANPEKYKKQYEKLCDCLGWDVNKIIRPYQTHTDIVRSIKQNENIQYGIFPENLKDVDGVVTKEKDTILATASADCILLLFYDPIKKVIANTHSGWQGTLKQISVNTIKKMTDEYGSTPSDIICCMAPSISKANFEVEEDVYEKFYNKFKNLRRVDEIFEKGEIKEEKQKYHIDTVLINRVILEDMGLKSENIVESKICTVKNSDIVHSFRVDKENSGRNNAFIMLK